MNSTTNKPNKIFTARYILASLLKPELQRLSKTVFYLRFYSEEFQKDLAPSLDPARELFQKCFQKE